MYIYIMYDHGSKVPVHGFFFIVVHFYYLITL